MTTIILENTNYKDELKKKNSKPLLWIALVSIVMFFSGLTSAVIVSQGGGGFIEIPMPTGFTISTLVIVLSSLVFHHGFISVKKGNYGMAKISVGITLLLGLLFVFTQYMGSESKMDPQSPKTTFKVTPNDKGACFPDVPGDCGESRRR